MYSENEAVFQNDLHIAFQQNSSCYNSYVKSKQAGVENNTVY